MPSPTQATTAALQTRLTEHAKRWPQITEVTVRYRANFAYIDAVLDDSDQLQLCRLRDTGHPEQALDCACGLYLGDPPQA
jgi:hypothetical protein